jgi:DNA-binding NtrC family response regulator
MAKIVDRILLVDDDISPLKLIKDLLVKKGYYVDIVDSVDKAIKYLNSYGYKAVLTDLMMPGKSGIDLLEYCYKNLPKLPVIIITAYGTIESAVNTLKNGAFDYITKPIQIEELLIVIKKAISHQKIQIKNLFLSQELSKHENYYLITNNSQFKKILETIDDLRNVDSSVLITGETGTGKEVIARLIHKNSIRKDESFVPINCGALPESLLESELFGYEKGAFTDAKNSKKGKLEIADGGTLFLDEVEALSIKAQAALLRFIQEGEIIPLGTNKRIEVNVRLIVASNKDLKEMCRNGKFREDFYYRISVFPILIPSLRERKEDIINFAQWMLENYCIKFSKKIKGFTKDAKKALLEYNWPGNIRELKNCIERASIIEKTEYVQKDSLYFFQEQLNTPKFDNIGLLPLNELESAYIKWALQKLDGNKTLVAEKLKISTRGLYYKLEK